MKSKTIKNKDFTKILLVNKNPKEVFSSIQNVRQWWSGFYDEKIEGSTEKLNDEFSFNAGGGVHYSKLKLIKLIPGKKIVWQVTESELSFLEEKHEWVGTKISFDISIHENKTKIVFTHMGLIPKIECYNGCSEAWTKYLDLLANNLS